MPLLPQYRGAAPLNWAIINGEKETGVTTFDKEIDTGKIIQQERVPIADTDDVGIIRDKLMILGSDLLLQTVDAIIRGDIHPKPQDELFHSDAELKPAPKIFKDTCLIDFSQPVKNIYNLIRGLSLILRPGPSCSWPMALRYLSRFIRQKSCLQMGQPSSRVRC